MLLRGALLSVFLVQTFAWSQPSDCTVSFRNLGVLDTQGEYQPTERVEICFPSGSCVVFVNLGFTMGGKMHPLAFKALGRGLPADLPQLRTDPAVNCHAYAFTVNEVPLPERTWIDAKPWFMTNHSDPVPIILKDFFVPIVAVEPEQFSSLDTMASLQEGDYVGYRRGSEYVHSGVVVKKRDGFRNVSNWVRSKNGGAEAVDLPLGASGEIWKASQIEIHRRNEIRPTVVTLPLSALSRP